MSTNGRVILPAGVRPASSALPVECYRDAAPYLRRPFMPNAIRFKVQAQFGGKKQGQGREQKYVEQPTGGMVVAYIDARLVIDRLNMVCPHLWFDSYEQVMTPQGSPTLLRCRLSVDGITREDVGQGNGKAAWSDALKRSGVKFGIGVSLYAVPRVTLNAGGAANQLFVAGNAERGFNLRLTDANEAKLRKGYEQWLDREGRQKFGEPLDHGDAELAQGDPYDPDHQEREEPDGRIPDEQVEEKPPGRKIKAEQAEEFAARFDAEAPPDITPDDLNLRLRELTGAEEGDNLTLLRSLRGSQLAELNGWLEAVKGGALA